MDAPRKPRTVLVVDDDPDFCEQLQWQLKREGFQVETAGTQREAEAAIARSAPDLVIADLMMESVDSGFALCYHIKKHYPGMPVILVTSVTSETGMEFDAVTDEERSWVKADVMLAKPVRFEQLLREIHRLLKD